MIFLKKNFRLILGVVISLILAYFLLLFAFNKIDWKQFMTQLKSINYFWVLVSMFLSIPTYLLRAFRWNLLLEKENQKAPTVLQTTYAVFIGYLVNLFVPRMGELARCGVLHRNHNIPISYGIGSVLAERVFDMLTLIFLFCINFLIEWDLLLSYFKQNMPNNSFSSLSFFKYIIILVIFGISAWFLLKKILNNKFKSFFVQIQSGLLSIWHLKQWRSFLISSIFIWVLYYWMSYIIVFSMPQTENLHWQAGLTMLTMGALGMVVPVQGGLGSYHLAIASVLVFYGIDFSSGMVMATVLHTSQMITVIFFGLISLISLGIYQVGKNRK